LFYGERTQSHAKASVDTCVEVTRHGRFDYMYFVAATVVYKQDNTAFVVGRGLFHPFVSETDVMEAVTRAESRF